MRHLAGTLLAIGALCGLATGGLAQTPKKGGTLSFAVTGDTPTYDCHATTTYGAIHVLAPHYSLLIKADTEAIPRSRATSPRAGRPPTTRRPIPSSCARASRSTMVAPSPLVT